VQTLIKSDSHVGGKAAVDFYFIQDDGGSFKATVPFEPYFFVGCRAGSETQVEEWLIKKYEGLVIRTERRKKWDLSLVSVSSRQHAVSKADRDSLAPSAQPSAFSSSGLCQDLFPQHARPPNCAERPTPTRHREQCQTERHRRIRRGRQCRCSRERIWSYHGYRIQL
jgi:hypothetical protein